MIKLFRFIALGFCLILVQTATDAQRKEIGQAKTILKSGRRVEEAEKLMLQLLKDSANRGNEKIHALLYESLLMQYQAVNEKLYMKQRQDTAQFFELTRRLFSVAETLDSIDIRPDKKGKVDIDYRKNNALQLNKIRQNLFFGCTYYVRKGDFKKAYQFGEAYMDCARQPLFSEYHLDSLDTRMPEAAYWTTYSGYRLNDPVLTLRHRKLALRDTLRAEFTLQYMAEARRSLKDDSLYLETLHEGFRRYPLGAYFFPRLMDFYTERGENKQALKVVNRALEVNDSSQLFIFAKSSVLFNMQNYDECIELSKRLTVMNDSMPEPFYMVGTAYLNKALKMHPIREKKQLQELYRNACPYMERYRQLVPDEKQKWGPALYRIYLGLNMGQQFDEIDRLLNK